MNGMMLWGIHQPLVMSELTQTLPPVGDVYVRLKSAALNKRDYWITQGKYPGLVFPLVPGSDGAGIVDGREVIIDPSIQWGENPDHFGPGFKILGMPDHGTLAQMVKVPEQNLYDKPSHLTWNEAAALPVTGVTAYRALFTRGKAKPGQRLLISGIGGGVATMALLFGIAHRMEVWVTSSSDEKIKKAISYGARGGVNYTDELWEKKLMTKAGRFDIVIDGAGGSGLSKFIPMMNNTGKIVIYGGTSGNMNDVNPQRIFWKHLDILGSTMGSPSDFQDMLEFVTRHQIRPIISHTFPLAEANAALEIVAHGKQFGKVCIEIE